MNPLFSYEKNLLEQGINLVAGVDEVGRGPLAGPMVVCALMLDLHKINAFEINDINNDFSLLYRKINDSKKVSEKNRRQLNEFLIKESISYSIIEISSTELDEKGISASTQKAFFNAVYGLRVKPQHVLTDTFEIKKITKETQTNIIKGDSKSISIAAASIVAKVYRDALMTNMHTIYPQYGFDIHKGYGTKKHMDALKQYGPCEIHRKSFQPIKSMLDDL